MKHKNVYLTPLTADDREQFIVDNQWAFKHGALIEFGERDNHLDEDEEIISRKTIEHCLDKEGSKAYRIMLDGRKVGGVILQINNETYHNELEILFVLPDEHSKGIGYGAWQAVEALHPETEVWKTCTPYFDKRNIHFYVNKCGFHIHEFWCKYFKSDHDISDEMSDEEGPDEMFRFIKVMKKKVFDRLQSNLRIKEKRLSGQIKIHARQSFIYFFRFAFNSFPKSTFFCAFSLIRAQRLFFSGLESKPERRPFTSMM